MMKLNRSEAEKQEISRGLLNERLRRQGDCKGQQNRKIEIKVIPNICSHASVS